MRKRILAGFISAVLLTGLLNIMYVGAAGSDYEVKIVGASNVGKGTYDISFQVKTLGGAKLNRIQSLDLAYDATVLKLTTMKDGTSLEDIGLSFSLGGDYIELIDDAEKVEVVSDLPSNAWDGKLYGAMSLDGSTGYVSLQPTKSSGSATSFPNITTLMKIRFAFQAGKTINDLTYSSFRFPTASELTALHSACQIMLNDGTDFYSYGFGNGNPNTLVIEPEWDLELGNVQRPTRVPTATPVWVPTSTPAYAQTATPIPYYYPNSGSSAPAVVVVQPSISATPTPMPALTSTPAPGQTIVTLTVGNKTYIKNGISAATDVAPYIGPDDRVMVPIRVISEALGATVGWEAAARTAIITQNGITLRIVIDQQLPDGMGTAVIKNDRTYVPIRYISEKLGATVTWDAVTQTVEIKR